MNTRRRPAASAAAIYVRISSDRNGEGLGVARQEADARALCERNGWRVVDVFCDNDISAWSGKPRPQYQAMLESVRAGEVGNIVAWHPDRLHRQTRELVGFIDVVEEHHVRVETVTAGHYDLSTPVGRMQARVLGAVAEYESDHKSARIRRKLEANAAAGRHHGGSRPYGWQADRITLEPTEAQVVREFARRVLAGESLRSIAKIMNEAGFLTATGRPWVDQLVRNVLLRERNAGLRVHHGEVIGRGTWEPILEEAEQAQVAVVLTDPRRRTTPGKDGQVHLLSSLARCGVCGGKMTVARGRADKEGRKPIYRCATGEVSRDLAKVDDTVTEAILKRLEGPEGRQLLVPTQSNDQAQQAMREADALRDQLVEAADAYAARIITMAQLAAINAQLQPRVEAAESAATTPALSRVLAPLLEGSDPRAAWSAMASEQRRAAAAALVEVILDKAPRGPVFDPDSVKVTWRAEQVGSTD